MPQNANKKRNMNKERTKRKCTKMHIKKGAFADGRLISKHDNAQELIMSLPAITRT